MSERENILRRVRDALREPAPIPGRQDGVPLAKLRQAAAEARAWLPEVGSNYVEWRELFVRNSMELKTEFLVCADQAAAVRAMQETAAREEWTRVACHGSGMAAQVSEALQQEVLRLESGYSVRDLESCQAGITACDALVAQTGSIVITSVSAGGRALSILPAHHIVIATRDQLVPDLPSAFTLLQAKYGENFPSMISFITGPSRTGDIERILVLGAHGPKKLSVLLVDGGAA